MDHGFMNNWSMNSLDEISTITSIYENDHFNNSSNIHSYSHHHHHQPDLFNPNKHYLDLSPNEINTNRPMKQQKSSSWSSSNSDQTSTPPHTAATVTSPIFHVVNSSNTFNEHHVSPVKPKEEIKSSFTMNFASAEIISPTVVGSYDIHQNQNYVFKASQGAKRVTTATNSARPNAQDHIIAERKRRQKLTQRFITMSHLLPGLKKLDKASVLGDAIKYIKELQEKVATLEEGTKKSVETAVLMKKTKICEDGNNFSSDENISDGPYDVPLPQIEAKICNKEVLIRVHCEKIKGVQEAMVAEIEKLHLSVMNSCALTFGSSTLDITIIAEMEEEFNMPIKDLVMHLRSALKKYSM
ncbi:OLC1v1002808C3 [Oldenlandia corymbosa var. corymbosa]|nr:OLC1v1002808C3 [Oldenlandia corymbosa var. corymbosa]